MVGEIVEVAGVVVAEVVEGRLSQPFFEGHTLYAALEGNKDDGLQTTCPAS